MTWTLPRLATLYLATVLVIACTPEPAEVVAPVVTQTPEAKPAFWADDTDVCVTKGPLPSTMLHWDVSGETTDDVVVYVMDPAAKDKTERNFSKGGPIDQHKTGPWLKPGMVFTLKEAGSNDELGSITIGEMPCVTPVTPTKEPE